MIEHLIKNIVCKQIKYFKDNYTNLATLPVKGEYANEMKKNQLLCVNMSLYFKSLQFNLKQILFFTWLYLSGSTWYLAKEWNDDGRHNLFIGALSAILPFNQQRFSWKDPWWFMTICLQNMAGADLVQNVTVGNKGVWGHGPQKIF